MRNRDFFIPSITTLILFGFVWFLSCAHQNRWKEEADIEFSETAEDPGNFAENADVPAEVPAKVPKDEKPEAVAESPFAEAAPVQASNASQDGFSYDSDSSDSGFSLEEETASSDSLAQKSSQSVAAENAPSVEPAPEVPSAPPVDPSLSAAAEVEPEEIPAPVEEAPSAEDSESFSPPKKM